MKRFILFSVLAVSGIWGAVCVAKIGPPAKVVPAPDNAAPAQSAPSGNAAPAQSVSASQPAPADNAAAKIEGYWQIIEKTNPEAIALVYQRDGALYIRMVALYNDAGTKITETITKPEEKAQGLSGNPYLCGLDFIWGLKPESGGKRFKGTVTDPDDGSSYACEVWFDEHKNRLVVRGELLIFGEDQYWPPISEADVPKGARLDVETIQLNLPPQS